MNRTDQPAPAAHRLTTPWGDVDLTRFPADPRDQLRAWDAADTYLLKHLAENRTDLSGAVVVVGDRWGALGTALTGADGCSPTLISDSYLGQQATGENLARKDTAGAGATLLTTQDTPPDRVDVLLVRVPKSLALLEEQLHRLRPALHEGTVVIGTGMVKEIHTSTLNLFERIIGRTRTSLAEKKARLIFSTPDLSLSPGRNPWPLRYQLPDGIGPLAGRTVVNHAGVFCAERLDIGTRFLLRHLPRGAEATRIVDLGCGNGVVGTSAALTSPDAEILFTDESHQAVASAEATYAENCGDRPGKAVFRAGDGLADVPDASVDLVLNNPPFHTHQATTDATAWRMFAQAHAALRPGGELWVVGNRHLGYHLKLRRLFGTSELVASDPKFVILKAVRQDGSSKRERGRDQRAQRP
ncbi:methyltransferase [Streptomyces kunmingensis]|uniref:Ribosomal RNA large subunit methyltransferase G n=1 Tax=Streptomyces kunmingensis TaxID=68225 RepID=A0ABU6CMY3_9ACTN|nr:methyltransferase [Streptomyces kunmingensis]MEB3966088.1 methyltransferase [Streptomyces kunmingensis]